MDSETHKKTVKVLFFSFWYPNKYKSNYALFVQRHAKALTSIFDTEVLSINIVKDSMLLEREYALETHEQGLKTHHLYIKSRFYKLLYVLLPLQYFIIKKIIQQKIKPGFDFNVIHSNILFPCAIHGYWLSKAFKCKHIITEHWSKLDKFFNVSAYKWIGKKALNKADALTCVSLQLNKTLGKYHQNPNSFVVPNVIDDSNFKYDTTIKKFPILTFTAVANWHAPKNPFYFLDALQQLQQEKKLPNFKVVLIGKGDLLDKAIKNNYSFTIETPGNLDPKSLNAHLNRCHVFLHGSDYETFSVVIIEALLCGLPCVVSPVGIANEVINELNGLIAKNDVNDWKEKILNILSKQFDHQIISGGIGSKYNSQSVANQFKTIYNNIGLSS